VINIGDLKFTHEFDNSPLNLQYKTIHAGLTGTSIVVYDKYSDVKEYLKNDDPIEQARSHRYSTSNATSQGSHFSFSEHNAGQTNYDNSYELPMSLSHCTNMTAPNIHDLGEHSTKKFRYFYLDIDLVVE
jgi:hypothetical protein